MTEKEAKKCVENAGGSWDVFSEWMRGQTMGMVDGKPDIYDSDVNRFIRYKCDPKKEPISEFD